MDTSRNLAVLFSVPESFLLSGLECISAQYQQEIHPAFLIYGSMEFEAFAEVEKARNGKPLEMFIYAANAAGDLPLNPEVTWKAFCPVLEGLRLEKTIQRNADRTVPNADEKSITSRSLLTGKTDAH
jgi:hypothetical protein